MNFNQGEQIQAHKYTLSLAERAQTNQLSLKKKKKNACINKLRQHENIVYAVHGIIHLNNIVY